MNTFIQEPVNNDGLIRFQYNKGLNKIGNDIMNPRKITNEQFLYLLAFLLAILLRLVNLGAFPLSDQEASWALQAEQISQIDPEQFDSIFSQPAYIFLTGISFFLFDSSNFLARFWPALIGSTLVISAYLLRNKLGRKTALILAWGLAMDPGMVAVSRQAGGPMMALGLAFLAISLWEIRKPVLAGIAAGLAMLSGPAIMSGILIGILGWLSVKRFQTDHDQEMLPKHISSEKKLTIVAALITLFSFGTFFFIYPQGISGWASSITDFLGSVSQPWEVSRWKMFVTSWVYQPLAWIFAIIAVADMVIQWRFSKAKPSQLRISLVIFTALALAIIFILPNHTTSDLIWVSIFIWAFAATELSKWLKLENHITVSILQASLVFIFSAMFWNTLVSVFQVTPQADIPLALLQTLVLTGIAGLAGLSAILIGYTWSWPVSRSGLVIGSLVTGLVYAFATLWSATQIRPNSPAEFWNPGNTIAQTDLLENTIRDLSLWQTGMPETIDIAVTADTPAVRWLLRDYQNVQFLSQVPTSNMPALILTPSSQESPTLSSAYRGQDFPWQMAPGWSGPLPDDFIKWLTFRQANEQKTWVVLWARVDLFPGEQLSSIPIEGE